MQPLLRLCSKEGWVYDIDVSDLYPCYKYTNHTGSSKGDRETQTSIALSSGEKLPPELQDNNTNNIVNLAWWKASAYVRCSIKINLNVSNYALKLKRLVVHLQVARALLIPKESIKMRRSHTRKCSSHSELL